MNSSWTAGIDVSMWQGDIDWRQVHSDGKRFCFIKATEGGDWVDPRFANNWRESKAAGLWRGAYHFFRPLRPVAWQVENFVATIGRLDSGDLPPVLDVEVPDQWTSIPQPDRAALIAEWLILVRQKLGIQPIVYLSPSFASGTVANASQLAEFPLWVAHWTSNAQPTVPPPWRHWTFWQHSSKGSCLGIAGAVDLDRFNGSLEELEKRRLP